MWVPRFLFSDFPLGNAAGKPDDVGSQAFTMELATKVLDLRLVHERCAVAATLERRRELELDFSNIEQMSDEEITSRRAEFDRNKQIARERRERDIKAAAAE